MKLDRDFLKTGKTEAKPNTEPVVAQNPVVPEPVKEEQQQQESLRRKVKFEYDLNLITPDQLAEDTNHHRLAIAYCETFGVKVCQHLKEAMELRADKEKVLSPREADICKRGEVNLGSQFFWDSLFICHGYLQEGELNFKLNPWEIRARYNNGLHWKNTARDKATPQQKQKGDAILIQLLTTLEEYKLPAYPAEKGMGFSRDFCRPEFLSWEQYDVIRAGFRMGTEEHQKELLT